MSFEDAVLVFADPLADIEEDSAHEPGRFNIVGRPWPWKLDVIFVVFVEISDDEVRLISARHATKHERDAMKNARRKTSRGVERPSKASLREMPERRAGAKTVPNKFAAKIGKAGGLTYQVDGEKPRWVPLPHGRPKKTDASEPSKPRSVRLPDSVWAELQERARERGIGVHTLLRELVAQFMGRAGTKPRKRARKVA